MCLSQSRYSIPPCGTGSQWILRLSYCWIGAMTWSLRRTSILHEASIEHSFECAEGYRPYSQQPHWKAGSGQTSRNSVRRDLQQLRCWLRGESTAASVPERHLLGQSQLTRWRQQQHDFRAFDQWSFVWTECSWGERQDRPLTEWATE